MYSQKCFFVTSAPKYSLENLAQPFRKDTYLQMWYVSLLIVHYSLQFHVIHMIINIFYWIWVPYSNHLWLQLPTAPSGLPWGLCGSDQAFVRPEPWGRKSKYRVWEAVGRGIISWLAQGDIWSTHPCWSSSGSVCILIKGRTGFTWTRSFEVCSYGIRVEVWRVSGKINSCTQSFKIDMWRYKMYIQMYIQVTLPAIWLLWICRIKLLDSMFSSQQCLCWWMVLLQKHFRMAYHEVNYCIPGKPITPGDNKIFCFSTLEERAARLFLTKGKNLDELDPSLFAKAKPGKTGKSK